MKNLHGDKINPILGTYWWLSMTLVSMSVVTLGLPFLVWVGGLVACFMYGVPWRSTIHNDYLMFCLWVIQGILYLGILILPKKYEQ